jgi:hypothetical protein
MQRPPRAPRLPLNSQDLGTSRWQLIVEGYVISRPSERDRCYDGHTLAQVIPAIEQLVSNEIDRLHSAV